MRKAGNARHQFAMLTRPAWARSAAVHKFSWFSVSHLAAVAERLFDVAADPYARHLIAHVTRSRDSFMQGDSAKAPPQFV